eukprot:g7901.t1
MKPRYLFRMLVGMAVLGAGCCSGPDAAQVPDDDSDNVAANVPMDATAAGQTATESLKHLGSVKQGLLSLAAGRDENAPMPVLRGAALRRQAVEAKDVGSMEEGQDENQPMTPLSGESLDTMSATIQQMAIPPELRRSPQQQLQAVKTALQSMQAGKDENKAMPVLGGTKLQRMTHKVEEEGESAKEKQWMHTADGLIRDHMLDYDFTKGKWVAPSEQLAKECPRQMHFASFVSSKYALLKTECADVNPDNCRACAVKNNMVAGSGPDSEQKDPDNLQDTCASIKVSFLCENMATAINMQIEKWKRRTAYVQPLFRPKDGFRTAYAEQAACVLGKAEAVLDTVYEMTHCSNAGDNNVWSESKGSTCYKKTVHDLDADIAKCCAGYEHIVLFEIEATCDATILPVLEPVRQYLKPAWNRCMTDAQECLDVKEEFKACSAEVNAHTAPGDHCEKAYNFGHALHIFSLARDAAATLYSKGGDQRDISEVAQKLLSDTAADEHSDTSQEHIAKYALQYLMTYDEAIGNKHDQR